MAGLVWLLVNGLLAVVALVSAGLLVWCRLAEARDRRGVHRESGSQSVGCARILVGWDSVPTGSGRRPNLLCVWWTAAWGVLAALLAARLVLDGLTAFPRDWDSLACHLTGMAVAATQPTIRQIVSAENDVAAAALFLAALGYSLRYLRGRRPADVALATTAVGLLAGVKYYALGYAAVAGAGLLLVLLARRRWTDAGKAAAWGVVGAVVWGGYWYARNFWVTGAPLFPKGFGDPADVCRPLWLPDQAVLLGYLDDQSVTIVVARPRDPQAKRWYAKFHGWISDRPDHFETIHEDSEYTLVRTLNRPRPNLTP